jgi:hypothetical protein
VEGSGCGSILEYYHRIYLKSVFKPQNPTCCNKFHYRYSNDRRLKRETGLPNTTAWYPVTVKCETQGTKHTAADQCG